MCQICNVYSSEKGFVLLGSCNAELIFMKCWNVWNLPLPLGSPAVVGLGGGVAQNIKWFQYLFNLGLFRGWLSDGLKGGKKVLFWLKLSTRIGKSKCSSKYGQNDFFDLQQQILSTDSSELCFHFSLMCGTIPWKAKPVNPFLWGKNPLPFNHMQRCWCQWTSYFPWGALDQVISVGCGM